MQLLEKYLKCFSVHGTFFFCSRHLTINQQQQQQQQQPSMKMSSVVVAATATAWLFPMTIIGTTTAFVRQTVTHAGGCSRRQLGRRVITVPSTTTTTTTSSRLFSTQNNNRNNNNIISSIIEADVKVGVSRLETLQRLLSEHGAPGSSGCSTPDHDLVPIIFSSSTSDSDVVDSSNKNDDETPELISTITGDMTAKTDDTGDDEQKGESMDNYLNLHPHLYPIAKSKSTGHVVCALRRAFAGNMNADLMGSSNSNKPQWPIVETTVGGLGYKLLALNSDHLMHRIVCECDFNSQRTHLIDVYNNQDVSGSASSSSYVVGSVEKLGYGVDKYVLLRVGPFADVYETLAHGHASKGDESSALIAAEAANSKISGFASTFLFYAKLLNSFPNREEESRDAARMCLRMPLPSIGYSMDDFRQVAILSQIAAESDPDDVVLAKLQSMHEKMKAHESDDPQSSSVAGNDMTPEQKALDDANYLLDTTALTGSDWSSVRPKLAEIYRSVGRDDMADFVHPSGGSSISSSR
jgi:hypothetical protein